jgi:hypothetical protein
MSTPGFTTTFRTSATPEEVFDAIADVRGWWSEDITGACAGVGDEFTFSVPGVHYSRILVTEFEPEARIAWLVLENRMTYVADQSEWVGTTISFEIVPKGDTTEVRFTHIGLVPAYECFDSCSTAWTGLMQHSLSSLIATGTGRPYRSSAAG